MTTQDIEAEHAALLKKQRKIAKKEKRFYAALAQNPAAQSVADHQSERPQ